MNILNARLRGRSGLYRIELDGARIAAISAQQAPAEASEGDIDAASNWWYRPSSNRTSIWTPPLPPASRPGT